jgi:hypothetical protein
MSEKEIRLTKTECEELVCLVRDKELDGSYYGNKKQYLARLDRIKRKLLMTLGHYI